MRVFRHHPLEGVKARARSRRQRRRRFQSHPTNAAERAARHRIPQCGPLQCTSCARYLLLTPRDRVVGAHRSSGIARLVERRQYPNLPPWVAGNCTIRRCAPRTPASSSSTNDLGAQCGWSCAGSRGGSRIRRRRAAHTMATDIRCRVPNGSRRARRRIGCIVRTLLSRRRRGQPPLC
jgi:hypothetical protein